MKVIFPTCSQVWTTSFHGKTDTCIQPQDRYSECRFFMPFIRDFPVFKQRMHQVHEFAFVFYSCVCQPAPALARLGADDAPALKAPR